MSFGDVDVAAILAKRNDGARRLGTAGWSSAKDIWCGRTRRTPIRGRGYGLVATDSIPKGSLICAARALEIVYEDECSCESAKSDVQDHPQHAELAKRLCDRLRSVKAGGPLSGKDLQFVHQLFSLYDGSDAGYGTEELSPAEQHTKPVRARLGLDSNGLACLPNDLNERSCQHSLADMIRIDEHRILGMLKMNADDAWCFAPAGGDRPRRRRMQGSVLFGSPCWLNHAFDANVVATTVCDVVLLRAARDIGPGEELTRSYTSWCWDQHGLQQSLGKFGIDLESCYSECARLFPSAAVGHARWAPLCRLMTSLENEISCAGPSSSSLAGCEKAFVQIRRDWAVVFDSSAYLAMRLNMAYAELKLRRKDLKEALDGLTIAIDFLSQCSAPAGEFARYCTTMLLIAVGLHQNPPPDVKAHVVSQLVGTASDLGAAFLGSQVNAFKCWVRCWFGADGPMEPLLEMLEVQESQTAIQSAATFRLDTMD